MGVSAPKMGSLPRELRTPVLFLFGALEGDKTTPPAHVRITTCEIGHFCSHGKDLKRAVATKVRRLDDQASFQKAGMMRRRRAHT